MKKTIAILLACMTFVLCAVSAYAGYEIYDVQPLAGCCSTNGGVSHVKLLVHEYQGGGACRAIVELHCDGCCAVLNPAYEEWHNWCPNSHKYPCKSSPATA